MMYLGKNWDDVTRELVRRACNSGLLPDTAEFQLRQFLEDGIVVIAYQKGPSNRAGRGGTTNFFEVRVGNEEIVVRQLTSLGPISPIAV
ncbi:MAG: hypothetical protein VKN33_01900 [Candidatus Sericytochromatia bacterium]|nr:hypothetical protein [Candidatus Sericytochromatia bacterium]